MADMPTPQEIELAELLGADAGERGLPREANPWPMAEKGRERVLHFRWRTAWAGARPDSAIFGDEQTR